MILLSAVTDAPGPIDTDCPSCRIWDSIPSVPKLNASEGPKSLLRYGPLDLLKDGSQCEALFVDRHCQLVFGSVEEPAAQVRARLRLSNAQSISSPANLSP